MGRKKIGKTINHAVKPIAIRIEEGLWKKFKSQTPRTITLNDAIVSLIEKEVQSHASS